MLEKGSLMADNEDDVVQWVGFELAASVMLVTLVMPVQQDVHL